MGCFGSTPEESGKQREIAKEKREGDWADDDAEMAREENIIEGTINYKVDDVRFVEMQKWPVILLDTTGSMNLQCEQNDPKLRNELVYETIWQMAQMLIPFDDFDNKKTVQQSLLLKGIPLITFNAMDGGVDRGLLHPQNFVNEWRNIEWHGGTHIMDGWRKMLRAYENRFTDLPQSQWPLLLALLITDGELQDGPEFEEHLKTVKGRMFVEIAVVGFGDDHDRALEHYNTIAAEHDHVRITSFTDHLDPALIVKQLLSLIDPNSVKQIRSDLMLPPNLSDLNVNNNNNNYYSGQNVSYVNNTGQNMVYTSNPNQNMIYTSNPNQNMVYTSNPNQNMVYTNNSNQSTLYNNNVNTMNNSNTYWTSSNNASAPPFNPT